MEFFAIYVNFMLILSLIILALVIIGGGLFYIKEVLQGHRSYIKAEREAEEELRKNEHRRLDNIQE